MESALVEPRTGVDLVVSAVAAVRQRLPSGWGCELVPTPKRVRLRPDALLRITASDGVSTTVVLEAKTLVEGRDVEPLRVQLSRYQAAFDAGSSILVAQYISPPVRDLLASVGVSFVDATGNIAVRISKPGLYISDRGADRNPWRGPGRPTGTLKGMPAGKVVRALVDLNGPWTARELVNVSGASTGATYRVLDFLDREGLVAKDEKGRYVLKDWAQLLRRWSSDYGFIRSNQITTWLAPRGLQDLVERIRSTKPTRYGITGTIAAAEWAAYAPARSAMIYVDDPLVAAELWQLRPTESGTNVLLAKPDSDVVFARTLVNEGGLVVVAPAQVATDLLTAPGRGPSEGEELIEWMIRNEPSWRT